MERYSYSAFGDLKRQGDKVKNTYTFTGREWDEEIGIYYYRARYYGPAMGRFISKDPLRFKAGVNMYTYVENNPIIRFDPSGLFSMREALWQYFFGDGAGVTVNFSEVDIGLQPADFEHYKELVSSMSKKEGTLSIDLTALRNIGGFAGQLTYRLKGEIKSNRCGWCFKGYVGAYNDTFDFNALSWGIRSYWAEIAVRIFGMVPGGKPYDIMFSERRQVTDSGTW